MLAADIEDRDWGRFGPFVMKARALCRIVGLPAPMLAPPRYNKIARSMKRDNKGWERAVAFARGTSSSGFRHEYARALFPCWGYLSDDELEVTLAALAESPFVRTDFDKSCDYLTATAACDKAGSRKTNGVIAYGHLAFEDRRHTSAVDEYRALVAEPAVDTDGWDRPDSA